MVFVWSEDCMRCGRSLVDCSCLLVIWHVVHLHSLLFRCFSSIELVTLTHLMWQAGNLYMWVMFY